MYTVIVGDLDGPLGQALQHHRMGPISMDEIAVGQVQNGTIHLVVCVERDEDFCRHALHHIRNLDALPWNPAVAVVVTLVATTRQETYPETMMGMMGELLHGIAERWSPRAVNGVVAKRSHDPDAVARKAVAMTLSNSNVTYVTDEDH